MRTKQEVKTKNNKVDKDSDKYKVALKFVNKILTNLGKEEVDDLTKFVNIGRDDILKEANKQSYIEMENELFPQFNKHNCGYYRKVPTIVLNCLRGMMKEIGYGLTYSKKDIYVEINRQNFRKTGYFYSIK